METKNNKSSNTMKIYQGKLFNVVVTNEAKTDPKVIERLTDPEYQQRAYQASLERGKKRYGQLLERLKYL